MKHLFSLFILPTLSLQSCQHTPPPAPISEEVTTFGFNHARTNTISVASSQTEMKTSSVRKLPWAKNALKHMPLLIKKESGDLQLIYSTKDGNLESRDLEGGKLNWQVKLSGLALSTSVYSQKYKTIYTLTESKKDSFDLVAVSISGEIASQRTIYLKTIYGNRSKKVSLDHILVRTALGLNEVNNEPYLFFGLATGRDPISKKKKRDLYGQTRGVTGAVIGVDINTTTGVIDPDKSLRLFFTSKINKSNPYKGFNSGIYLAGGAINLLDNNTLIVPVANGPSFPEEGNFGCSLVVLSGEDFKVNGYLSKDQEGYHECFITNKEFGNGFPNILKTKNNKYMGLFRDKSGNAYIFNPESLSKKKTLSYLSSDKIHKGVTSSTYSGGSFFKIRDHYMGIVGVNGFPNRSGRSSQTSEVVASSLNEKLLNDRGYSKKKCIGLIQRNGSRELGVFDSGPTLNNIFISKPYPHLSSLSLKELNSKLTTPVVTSVKNQKIPFKKIATAGFESDINNIPPKGFKHSVMGNAVLIYRSGLTDQLRNYDHTADWSKKRKENLIPIKGDYFNYLARRESQGEDCEEHSSEKYIELYIYEKNEPLLNTFSITGLKIDNDYSSNIRWYITGENNEVLSKSSIITIRHAREFKFTSVFHSYNKVTNQSAIYLIDSEKGTVLNKVLVPGHMHFSSILPTSKGLIIPTVNDGLILVKFKV